MPPVNIFMSDLHIGVNSPTNLYQKTFHEGYLKALLRYVRDKGPEVQDLVVLGDWFDLTSYLPDVLLPGVKDIIEHNRNIFFPIDDSGDFVSCLDSIRGSFYYIKGNHDTAVSPDDINAHFRPLSRYGRKIRFNNGDFYESKDIHAEHGHAYSLFSRNHHHPANRYQPLPISYYLTRIAALICKQKLIKTGQRNAALLEGSGKPVFGLKSALYSLPYILQLLKGKLTFAQAVLFDFAGLAGKPDPQKLFFKMPDGSRLSAADAADMFPDLTVDDWNGLLADTAVDLDRPGRELNEEHRVVVMGHTHSPKILQYHSPTKRATPQPGAVYVNTGFLCSSKPELELEEQVLSFVEVEQGRRKCVVRLKKVDYPTTDVSTFAECTLY